MYVTCNVNAALLLTTKVQQMAMTRKAIAANEWISLVEAARLLGESRQTVLSRAVKGEVVAQHIAGRTVVSRESVERVLAERR